jgi:Ran GTPase-activating protein (RanGAP) involved in mRNA processing and transport
LYAQISNLRSKYLVQGKKYDTKEQISPDLPEAGAHHEDLEEITLSGNSYGREACDYLAELFKAQKTPKLESVNFNDMFVSRKLLELPGSLEVLIRSILESSEGFGHLKNINLSDNAFGPAGIKSFDFLLREL